MIHGIAIVKESYPCLTSMSLSENSSLWSQGRSVFTTIHSIDTSTSRFAIEDIAELELHGVSALIQKRDEGIATHDEALV